MKNCSFVSVLIKLTQYQAPTSTRFPPASLVTHSVGPPGKTRTSSAVAKKARTHINGSRVPEPPPPNVTVSVGVGSAADVAPLLPRDGVELTDGLCARSARCSGSPRGGDYAGTQDEIPATPHHRPLISAISHCPGPGDEHHRVRDFDRWLAGQWIGNELVDDVSVRIDHAAPVLRVLLHDSDLDCVAETGEWEHLGDFGAHDDGRVDAFVVDSVPLLVCQLFFEAGEERTAGVDLSRSRRVRCGIELIAQVEQALDNADPVDALDRRGHAVVAAVEGVVTVSSVVEVVVDVEAIDGGELDETGVDDSVVASVVVPFADVEAGTVVLSLIAPLSPLQAVAASMTAATASRKEWE